MATIYKVLGQVNPSATTLTTLYTAGAANGAVASTLVICNQGIATNFRIATRPAGAAIVNQHYMCYDQTINQYDSLFLTLGVTLANTDVMSVYAGTGNVVFQLYGSEVS